MVEKRKKGRVAGPSCDPRLFARVVAAAQRLTGITLAERYDGTPVLQVDGRFMAGPARHVSAEADSLVIKIELSDRDAWLDEAPETYYITDYYRPHPVILVRLRRLDDASLVDLLRAGRQSALRTSARRTRRSSGRQ